MGMFDDVRCERVMPDGYDARGRVAFQSKDFECQMVEYRISGEGRMLQPIYRCEDVPKAGRPYPNAEDGTLQSIYGSVRTVYEKWHDMNYHGIVNFYTYDSDGKGGGTWHGYNAKFTEGQLVEITMDDQTQERHDAAGSESKEK